MNSNTANALNFSYLLLDYYKLLNINESELAVILMIDHLKRQDNEFITNSELLLKMNMKEKDIDKAMTSLYQKKYVIFSVNAGKPVTSIKPLKKILYKKFEESIFTEDELKQKKDLQQNREEIFELLEKAFSRQLTPIEISRSDEWFKSNVEKEIIINSIKDAINLHEVSINKIDRLIISKLKKEDKNGNVIK